MELFNTGGWELLVLLLLALVLFGPEDIIKFARRAGKYVRVLQRLWAQAVESLDLQALLEEDDDDLDAAWREVQSVTQELRRTPWDQESPHDGPPPA